MPQNSILLENQLEHLMNEVIKQDFPELQMASGALVPITNDVDHRAEVFPFTLFTAVGEAKILANGGTDVPLINAYVQKKMGIIRTLVDGYEITLEDLEAAEFAGMNISSEMAIMARRVIEEGIDRIGYMGAPENGLLGITTLPNVVRETAPNNGNVNGGTNSTLWEHKTPEQIYLELVDFLTRMRQATKGIEQPDTLLMPQAQYDRLAAVVYPANTDNTLLNFFLTTQRASATGVKNLVPVQMLEGLGTAGADMMIAYKRDPQKLRYEIPLDFEQRPPETVSFSTRVVCRSRLAGLINLKPMSVRFYEGI